jgi:hypothetical protein
MSVQCPNSPPAEKSWYRQGRIGGRFNHVFALRLLRPRSCRSIHERRGQGLSDHSAVEACLGPSERRGLRGLLNGIHPKHGVVHARSRAVPLAVSIERMPLIARAPRSEKPRGNGADHSSKQALPAISSGALSMSDGRPSAQRLCDSSAASIGGGR